MAENDAGRNRSLEERVSSLEARMDENERRSDDTRQLAAFVDRDIQRLEHKVDLNRRMITALGEQQAHGFAEVDKRFAGVDQRFAGLDQRVAGLDQRVVGLDQRLDDLTLATRAGFDQMSAGFATLAQLITAAKDAPDE